MIARETHEHWLWPTFANCAAKTRTKAEIIDQQREEDVARGCLASVL